jgi:tetratricopeptide (TPR) repeat protein
MPLSVGDRLARYEIRGLLGAGGMGEVYRAYDHRLDREVAIKVLPEGFADDPDRLRRFEREARAAALDHPNVLDVHDLGEHEGRAFIVTELLDGQSLREVIDSGSLTLEEAIDCARQISTGLAAAHDHGITHRDIKPANLFLTTEGQIKILDFGLAKLTRPKVSADKLSSIQTQTIETASGITMGTPGYLSPEQLQGRRADNRSDIFSLGIVLYQMITGRHPFPGKTTAEIHAYILKEDAISVSHFDPDVPPQLERVVTRCLEKRPEDRFESAGELLRALEELSAGEVTAQSTQPRHPALRRAAMVAAAIAAVVFVGVMFQRPSQGVPFKARDWLVITDVENLTGDTTLDHALDPALTVGIEQSSYVNVLSRNSMQRVLRQMKRDDAVAIDEALGREIARRKGIDVVLVPSISRLGTRYAMTASLRNAKSGETYVSRLVHAEGEDEILPSLDQLCRQIRGSLGETLSSISQRSRPLVEATTPSLEALEQFSLAHAHHVRSNPERAIQHYEAALRFDPDFTSAKAGLAILHLDWGHVFPGADPEMGTTLLSEAAAEAGSLTELERLAILTHHAQFVEQDLEHAAEISETLLSIYPDRSDNRHNLAIIYERMGRTDDAIAEYKSAIAADPDLVVAYNGLVWLLRRRTGDVPQMIEWAQRELEIVDDQPWPFTNLAWAYLAKGDGEGSVAAARRGVEVAPENFWCHYHLGHALVCAGEYEEAARSFEKVLELSPTDTWAHYHAAHALNKTGDGDGARRHLTAYTLDVEAMIEENPENIVLPMWLDYGRIALGEEPRSRLTEEQLGFSDPNLNWYLAQLYSLTGRTQEAIDRLEHALANGAENPIWILCIPTLEALFDEPRYQELKRRTLNLESEL